MLAIVYLKDIRLIYHKICAPLKYFKGCPFTLVSFFISQQTMNDVSFVKCFDKGVKYTFIYFLNYFIQYTQS